MPLTFAHPLAFCLLPPALLLLVLFRLLRSRRATLEVGSLLLWKRLSAFNLTPQKRKFVFDLALLLQALALLALSAALAFPALTPVKNSGRELFFMIDNGPLSRARQKGVPGLAALLENVRTSLDSLNGDDRVHLARSAPYPTLLSRSSVDKSTARSLLENVEPAMSGPEIKNVESFALDRARGLSGGAPLPSVIFSLSNPPETNASDAVKNIFWAGRAVSANMRLDNVAIVAAGSYFNERLKADGRRILVRVANFSATETHGSVLLEAVENGSFVQLETRPLLIEPHATHSADFRIPARIDVPVRVSWRNSNGADDVLPEDDAVLFFSRPIRVPRIRFFSPLPVLEKLFMSALSAEIISDANNADAADLDIYVQNVPDDIPASSKAALFVAPSKGYRGYFDIGASNLVWPKVESGDADALNADIPAGDAGIAVSKAVEILQTGDFKTLLRDAATRRALALKFSDEKSRPCYALAFVPNDGLAAERLLDPALAALLVRIAREAAQSGPPYYFKKVAALEAASGQPLPMNWRPDVEGAWAASGVLDERASNLIALRGAARQTEELSLDHFLKPTPVAPAIALDFLPWLALLGGVLVFVEMFLRGRN